MTAQNLHHDPVALFALVVSLALGLVIGSFLNVVIWRVPRGESIVAPPSACPKCSSHIRWFDNIPVLSWLLLKARCRNCGNSISWRYPLVELLTGIVFVALCWNLLGRSFEYVELLELLPLFYLGSIGVALALIDLDTHKLPNKIVLPSYAVVFLLLTLVLFAEFSVGQQSFAWDALLQVVLGCIALYAFYFVLCVVGGMGFGDVKLAGVLGMHLGYLGWEYLVIGGFLPFVLGGAFSVLLIVLKKAGRKSGIPFGPWMILGWFVAIFVSQPIADWYISTMF